MELLDRYLNFIRFLLPRGKRQDIIDELSADLQAQIADKEAELGRPLDKAELEALLKQCGHPLLVAARYQPEQQLIGQPFFALYLFALKGVAWVLLPLLLVVGALVALFHTDPIVAIIASVGDAFASAIYIVGVITVVFILLERLQVKLHFLEDWRPSELPKVPVVQDTLAIPRSDSFGSFLGLLVFSLWWTGAVHLPQLPNLHLLNPLPAGFYWPVLAVVVAEMLLHIVNLFLPWWTRRRAAVRLVIDVCALAVLGALIPIWPWFGLQIDSATVIAGLAPAGLARVEQVVNLSLLVSVCIIMLSYLLRVVQDARRALGKPPILNWLVMKLTH